MVSNQTKHPGIINPIDKDRLRREAKSATPFPHICIDDFVEVGTANNISLAYPAFEAALEHGKQFASVNERHKVQLTKAEDFPPSIRALHDALAAPAWLQVLGDIMGIPGLVADPDLKGGGMHLTGPEGFLDVHVDFNYVKSTNLHRRLNLLVFFNREWRGDWGGRLELWDQKVKHCHHSFIPAFNRCVIFETSEISYHGVTAVTCPSGNSRNSFAAYYYTPDPPPAWQGQSHSTIFRARPDENYKRILAMPSEQGARYAKRVVRKLGSRFRKT